MSVPFDLIFAGTSAAIALLAPVPDEEVVVVAVFDAELFEPPPQPAATTTTRQMARSPAKTFVRGCIAVPP
jgi:NADPH-dependent 2,4-dienoyl-CoA reductase/sulfur reductase-like enzyme